MDSTGVETGGSSEEEALAAAFAEALGGSPNPEAVSFAGRLAADYRRDELPGWTPNDLARAFADLWSFAAETPEGGVRLQRAAAPDAAGRPLDLLTVTEPDKPFGGGSTM